jgi:hypothetical protein
MDYRHTEDFARRMEAAALRAPALRAQAAGVFWGAVGRALLAVVRRPWQWLTRTPRRDTILPEA